MGQATTRQVPSSGSYSLSLRVTAEALWGRLVLDAVVTPAAEDERPMLGATATPGATEKLIER